MDWKWRPQALDEGPRDGFGGGTVGTSSAARQPRGAYGVAQGGCPWNLCDDDDAQVSRVNKTNRYCLLK